MTSKNIKVCIKVRPLIQREINENLLPIWSLVDSNTIKSNNKEYKLSFDHIFDERKTTEELFTTVAKPIVVNAVKGINGTIFAYGQTSSGKTYCMMGTADEPGIVPLTVREIFNQIEYSTDREFLVRIGYIEIYNERIFDLLDENKPEIKNIHENTTTGEVVVNQTEIVSSSVQSILENYERGSKGRRVGETCMNERSSRSHTIFRIVIESQENGSQDGVFQVSTLNLVDLAGSERVDQTKATGERLREGGHINKSLLSLSKVIRELSEINDNKEKNVDGIKYINYRDSKLTRILSASLGGNAMTSIICTITPVALEETYSTLSFASNAKKIKNQPKVNETISDKVIMIRLQKEIAALKGELEEERSKNAELPKIQQIVAKIFDRESQIIHSHSENVVRKSDSNRRRTWMCPSSSNEKCTEIQPVNMLNLVPPPPFILRKDPISPSPDLQYASVNDFSNEIFESPNVAQFDNQDLESPRRRGISSFNLRAHKFRTPQSLKPIIEVDSPYVGKANKEDEIKILRDRINYLENELEELQDFKMLEEKFSSASDEELRILEEFVENLKQQLAQGNEKVEMLENDMTEKMIEIENLKSLKGKCESMEIECKKALQEREKAENIAASMQYEYEQAQNKFKNREKELIQCLTEARNDSHDAENNLKEKIKNLEQTLLKTEGDLFALESQKVAQNERIIDSNKLLDLEKNIKELENRLQLAMKENEKVEKMLNEKNTEIEALSDQLVEAVQDTDSLQEKNKKLEEELQSRNNMLSDMTSKLLELEEISNRYQKIQQIVTVDETITTEYCHDENDEVCKVIVRLQQSATKAETLEIEYKQLLNQISENNRINEEVEELHNKIKQLEESIKCKENVNENLTKQLSEHEIKSDRYCKIQALLLNEEVSLNVDENDNVYQLITKLHKDSNRVELLEAEKLLLLSEINEIRRDAEILTEKLSFNQTLSETEFQLRERIDSLETELEEAKIQFEEQLLKYSDIESNQLDLQIKIEETQKEKEELEAQIAELKLILEEKNKAHENLQSQLNENHQKINKYENEISQFTSKLEELSNQDEKILESNKNYDSQILKLDEELSNSHSQLAIKEEEIKSLQSKLEEMKEQLELKSNDFEKEKLESQIANLNKIVEVKNSDNEILQIKLNGNLQKIAEYENEISQLTSKLEELNGQHEKILESNKNYDSQFVLKEEEIKTLQKELVDIKEQLALKSNEKKELQENLHTKINEISKLELKLDELNNQHDKIVEANTNYVSQLVVKEEEIKALQNEMGQTKEQFALKSNNLEKESFVSQITELNTIVKVKNDENEILQIKLNENLQKIAEYENEISQLTSKLEELNGQYEKILESNKDYDSKVLKLNAELSDSRSQLATKEEEVESLQNEITEIMKQLALKSNDFEKFEAQISELKKIVEVKNDGYDKLQIKLDGNNLKIAEYENEISQLTSKLEELSNQHKKILESNKNYDSQVLKLDAELTNSRSRLLLKEEEFKILRNDFENLKIRHRRRSEDNERKLHELETANIKLIQDVGASEAMKIATENEFKKLKDEYCRLSNENKSIKEKNNDNDMKYTILDEKYSQLYAANLNLEKKILEFKNNDAKKQLEREIVELNRKICQQASDIEIKTKLIADLEEKSAKAVEESRLNPKKSSSPSSRRSDEKELFSAQHRLQVEGTSSTPVRSMRSNIDRKSRRQSVYDERRDLSAWELTQSESTQTDPVDKLCGCLEFSEKIKQLQIEIRLRDCKIANAQRMANVNIYKYELEDLKEQCQREKRENSNLKEHLDNLKEKLDKVQTKMKTLERNQRCSEVQACGVQTDDTNIVSKDEFDKILKEKSALERKMMETKRQLSQEKISAEKENLSSNTSKKLQEFSSSESSISGTLNNKKLDYETLESENNVLKRKYDTARKLCNLRNDDLNKLREELQNMTALAERMTRKYESAKSICELRLEKIQNLRLRLEEKSISQGNLGGEENTYE